LYLAGALGLLRLRAFSVARAGEPFLAPGGSALPLALAAIIVWMLSSLEWKELLATACVVIVSTAVYSVLFRKGLASFRGQPPALLEEAGGLSR
jgi:hypothetical protein